MKVVILAGGLGTRLSEETAIKPKPMVEIGGSPILWHIIKLYSSFGINDVIVCLGYRGSVIKEYFANYFLQNSDVTFDMANDRRTVHRRRVEPWRVTLVDTGQQTMTGGRLRRVRDYLNPGESFCFTYGDGVGDVDISRLIDFHNEQGRIATVTAVRPPGRFGALSLEAGGNIVTGFREKPQGDGAWINGGYFVLEPEAIDYIDGDASVWEAEPMERLASAGQLAAYRHDGFWQPMDTLRDKKLLEDLWSSGKAPWKIWRGDEANGDGRGLEHADQAPDGVAVWYRSGAGGEGWREIPLSPATARGNTPIPGE